jgi:hypothetical protein
LEYLSLQFQNIGFIKASFSNEQLAPLRKEIEKLSRNFNSGVKHNHKLAGNLQYEFLLKESKKHTYNLVAPLFLEFDKQFNNYITKNPLLPENSPIELNELWVNFQKKHEFNPIHDHTGIMSFVIWMQIPYLIEDELKASPGASANPNLAGHFAFHYTDTLGDIRTYNIPADKTQENTILLFPARMKHSVFPFYSSDDYRITVSGNFTVKKPT